MRERLFPRSRQTVCAARAFTAQTLSTWGLDDRRDDVLLCVSELATNALRHGTPPGRGYRVRLLAYEGGVRVEVHDSGPGLSRTAIGSGFGLRIVAAVSDGWGAVPRSPGKVVWCEFVTGGRTTAHARRTSQGDASTEAGRTLSAGPVLADGHSSLARTFR
ncbi:ATP-binding protein [Streptomyces sp. NPDC012888]|uniref:ATP-binding protein n=1 Tax=Streptomyces sp. NPDC012888 TaxID=3364855 RepID=UPI00367D538B